MLSAINGQPDRRSRLVSLPRPFKAGTLQLRRLLQEAVALAAKRHHIRLAAHDTLAVGAEVLPPDAPGRRLALRRILGRRRRILAHRVILADVVERALEVVDEAGGREGLATARTLALGGVVAGAPIEFDADGSGPLDDMKELAERQRDQPENDNRLVRQRDEPVIRPTEPRAIGSQRQSRDDDGEEQRQRHDIEAEPLDSDLRQVVEAAMNRQNDPDQQQQRREVECMVKEEAKERVRLEREEREAERPQLMLGGGCLSEAQPA